MSLDETQIAALLEPYLSGAPVPPGLYSQLSVYLELLLRWNARTNLTAIRDPEEIVRRHFGESLFTGGYLAGLLPPGGTLLDFGSGAGFPGVPIQLLVPNLRVTLAESQGKKASFLREAVRALGLRTEVWAGRVEVMSAGRVFDAVALRAVDKMENALSAAALRVVPGGVMAVLAGSGLQNKFPESRAVAVPESGESFLYLIRG